MDVSTLNGFFTEAYGSSYVDLPADHALLTKRLKFESGNKIGNEYHFPVILTMEQGITFNSDGTGFTLNDEVSMASKDAKTGGYESLVRGTISYAAITRIGGGKKQFVAEVGPLVKLAAKSMAYHLELSKLYGQTGLAITSEVTASGTTGTFTVTAATWAPGIWSQAYGMKIDFWDSATGSTKTNGSAVSVTSVNLTTRVVSFTCASGDAAGLDALTTSTIFRFGTKTGASSFKESVGVDKIITNSGSLFGIDAATYALWLGNSVAAAGNLTLAVVQDAQARLAAFGVGKDMLLICSPKSWRYLITEFTALRKFDASYKEAEFVNGAKGLRILGQVGDVEIMPHPMCKEGEAFLFSPDELHRIGSTEPTYKMPGFDNLLFPKANSAALEFRLYSDEALIPAAPSHMVKITGITNA